MKVFADFHHDDLFHSLHLLFEKRLGWELYCPIGLDWYTQGYWNYSMEPRVVQEMLGSGRKSKDVGGHCLVENPTHNRNLKALTFEQFKDQEIDIIISSVPEHLHIYQRLKSQFKPKAKLIQQVGNEWKNFDYSVAKNIMISCSPFKIPSHVNKVFYHQEFDLKDFNYVPSEPSLPICSFVNDLINLKDWQLFQQYEKTMSEWGWKSYGLGCRDGNLRPLTSLIRTMKASSFIFHAKSLGDGFGHIIHNAFALGRPVLVRGKWYKGRLAGALIQDQVTCIDLDKHTFEENCKLIKEWAKPEKYHQMSQAAVARFNKVVNYDQEFLSIKSFLEKLQ